MIEKCFYTIKWYGRSVIRKYTGISSRITKYNGERILSSEEGNNLILSSISEAFDQNKGYFVGRYGSNELDTMVKFENYCGGNINSYQKNVIDRLCMNAGFFPQDTKMIIRYVKEMKEASSVVDLVGVWFNPLEDYILRKYAPEAKCCHLSGLEPYFYTQPWSMALKGKKVLVIHPFVESILQQYTNIRTKLFRNPDVLPEFELVALKAVQTIAEQRDPRFNTWFDALEYMEKVALEQDFDVAIIGCGAYGFPLAARLKKRGKIVIHLGGATQVLFGVKGSRWEKISSFHSIINEYWIYPLEAERPRGAEKIEGACYW